MVEGYQQVAPAGATAELPDRSARSSFDAHSVYSYWRRLCAECVPCVMAMGREVYGFVRSIAADSYRANQICLAHTKNRELTSHRQQLRTPYGACVGVVMTTDWRGPKAKTTISSSTRTTPVCFTARFL